MRAIFQRWLETLDPHFHNVALDNGRWGLTASLGLALVALAGLVPGTRDFFGLRLLPAVVCFVPALVSGWGFRLMARRGRASLEAYGAAMLLSASTMVFFAGSLVSFSAKVHGATAMVSIPLFVAGFYGYLLRCSFGNPVGACAIAAGLLGAVALSPDRAHSVVFALTVPAAFGGAMVVGTMALDAQRQRRRQEVLEAAISAQRSEEESRDATRLADVVLQVLEKNHDAGNALSTALLTGELLSQRLHSSHGDADLGTFKQLADELMASLTRISTLVHETRHLSQEGGARTLMLEEVDVVPVLTRVTDEARRALPHVRIEFRAPASVPVAVCGGEDALYRIFDNLIRNACEGNGKLTAARVSVSLVLHPSSEEAWVVVTDDGPGFPEHQLARSIGPWETTKARGLGLGLFIVERLLRASGGRLTRENGSGGGAAVRVQLKARSQA